MSVFQSRLTSCVVRVVLISGGRRENFNLKEPMATKSKTPTAAPAAPGDVKMVDSRVKLLAIAAEAKHGDVRQAVADLATLLAGK